MQKKIAKSVTNGKPKITIIYSGWPPDLENEIPGDFQEISRRYPGDFKIFPGDNFEVRRFQFLVDYR